jgi:hypothetical protein
MKYSMYISTIVIKEPRDEHCLLSCCMARKIANTLSGPHADAVCCSCTACCLAAALVLLAACFAPVPTLRTAGVLLPMYCLQDFSVQNDSDFPALGGAGDLGGDLDKNKVRVCVCVCVLKNENTYIVQKLCVCVCTLVSCRLCLLRLWGLFVGVFVKEQEYIHSTKAVCVYTGVL